MLSARLDALTVGGSASVDGDAIRIDLARGADRDLILDLVTRSGDVQFRPVLDGPLLPSADDTPDVASPSSPPANQEATLPSVRVAGEPTAFYRLAPARLDGTVVEHAEVAPDGEPAVRLTLHAGATGIDAFNAVAAACVAMTETCPTGALAVVVDGVVISAPRLATATFERDAIQISGSFTEEDAASLAALIASGTLPLEFAEG